MKELNELKKGTVIHITNENKIGIYLGMQWDQFPILYIDGRLSYFYWCFGDSPKHDVYTEIIIDFEDSNENEISFSLGKLEIEDYIVV